MANQGSSDVVGRRQRWRCSSSHARASQSTSSSNLQQQQQVVLQKRLIHAIEEPFSSSSFSTSASASTATTTVAEEGRLPLLVQVQSHVGHLCLDPFSVARRRRHLLLLHSRGEKKNGTNGPPAAADDDILAVRLSNHRQDVDDDLDGDSNSTRLAFGGQSGIHSRRPVPSSSSATSPFTVAEATTCRKLGSGSLLCPAVGAAGINSHIGPSASRAVVVLHTTIAAVPKRQRHRRHSTRTAPTSSNHNNHNHNNRPFAPLQLTGVENVLIIAAPQRPPPALGTTWIHAAEQGEEETSPPPRRSSRSNSRSSFSPTRHRQKQKEQSSDGTPFLLPPFRLLPLTGPAAFTHLIHSSDTPGACPWIVEQGHHSAEYKYALAAASFGIPTSSRHDNTHDNKEEENEEVLLLSPPYQRALLQTPVVVTGAGGRSLLSASYLASRLYNNSSRVFPPSGGNTRSAIAESFARKNFPPIPSVVAISPSIHQQHRS